MIGRSIQVLVLGVLCAGCAPPPVSHDPAADLAEGWRYYRLGEYDLARKRFAAVSQLPETAARLPGLYALGVHWHLRRPGEDWTKARQYYQEVIAAAPESDWAAWSRLALARMTHLVPADQQPDLATVVTAYQEVRDRHAGHPASAEAMLFQQSIRLAQRDPVLARQVEAELTAFLAAQPQSPFVAAVHTMLAQVYLFLDQPVRQLAALLQALKLREIDPLNRTADLAGPYWQIAVVAEYEVGDWVVARQYYQRLIEEYRQDHRCFLARQSLARMEQYAAQWRTGGGGAR